MESESDSDITRKCEKAKAERKAEIKKKQRKENRNIKARESVKKQRLQSFKESYKGPKPKNGRKDWNDVKWQNYWDSLTNTQQRNLSRSQSHSVESLSKKIREMAEIYNASININIRFPNGKQPTKYHLASGCDGIRFSEGKDGKLVKQLWEHHFLAVQKKRMDILKQTKLADKTVGLHDQLVAKTNPIKKLHKRLATFKGRHNLSKRCDPPVTPANSPNTTVSFESATHPTRHSPSLASFFDSPSSSMELIRISQPEICSEESLTSPSLVCELSVPNPNIAERDSVSRHLVRPMAETPHRPRSIRRGLPKRAMIHQLAQEASSALKDVKLAIHSEVVLKKLPYQSGDIPYRKLTTAKTDLKLPPNPGRRASINVNKGRGRGKKLSFAAPTSSEGFQLEKSSRNEKNTQSSSKDGLMFYSRIYSSDSDSEK